MPIIRQKIQNSSRQVAAERHDYATNELKKTTLYEQEATRTVNSFETEIAALKKSKATPIDIKTAEQRLKYADIKLKDAKEARKKTEKNLNEAKKALVDAVKAADDVKLKLAKEEKKSIEAQQKAATIVTKKVAKPQNRPPTTPNAVATKPQNDKKETKKVLPPTVTKKEAEKTKTIVPSAITYKDYNAADDVMLNPPKSPCRIASDQYDDFSAKRRRETRTRTLFTYTNEVLRPSLKEKEFLTCEAAVVAVNNARSLSLTFVIASDMAQREFGALERGSKLLFTFVNGKVLEIVTPRTDNGKIDGINKTTTYQMQYPLEEEAIKTLMKNELDRVRVTWSTGHEEYEVYDLDLFADQLACLAK
jgi:hypothetical protein